MPWFIQLIIYFCSVFVSFAGLSNLEWAKITRTSRREFVWVAYILISIAVGSLIGLFITNIVNIFLSIGQVTLN